MTIARVTPRVAKTCVSLQTDSGRIYTCDDISVLVQRAGYVPPKKQWVWVGCQHVQVCGCGCYQQRGNDDNCCTDVQYNRTGLSGCGCGCHDIPTLEYKAFDTDESGRVCFHWDGLLYRQPPGRYTATIINRDRHVVGYFEIELARDNVFVAEAVAVNTATNCGMCE